MSFDTTGCIVESTKINIHPTAILSPGSKIGKGVVIGPYSVIGPDVEIKEDTYIGPHVVLDGITHIGANCKLVASCSIGLPPQDITYKDEPTGVKVGDDTVIREYVTVHRASKEGFTTIGSNCFLMNYVHVGHNVKIGNNVIIANAATFAGYVTVEDHVFVSAYSAMHQYCRIGESAMLGAVTASRLDLPPYFIADGRPAKIRGVNIVGLRRRGIKQEIRSELLKAYKIIYLSGLNTKGALEKIEKELLPFDEINKLVAFFRTTKRGVTKNNTDKSSADNSALEE